jgi:hypothetical protein
LPQRVKKRNSAGIGGIFEAEAKDQGNVSPNGCYMPGVPEKIPGIHYGH